MGGISGVLGWQHFGESRATAEGLTETLELALPSLDRACTCPIGCQCVTWSREGSCEAEAAMVQADDRSDGVECAEAGPRLAQEAE